MSPWPLVVTEICFCIVPNGFGKGPSGARIRRLFRHPVLAKKQRAHVRPRTDVILYEFAPLSCNTLKNKVRLAIFSSPLGRRICLSPVQWFQDFDWPESVESERPAAGVISAERRGMRLATLV